MKWMLFLSLPLYALDQISKYWIFRHIDPESNQIIIPRWFYLVNVPNTGAAFGSFRNNNAFFIVLSCVALVAVVSLLLR
jgi:signal peptidase II